MNTAEHAVIPAASTDISATASVSSVPFQPRDCIRLAQGFYFLFFGTLGSLITLIETFLVPSTRPSLTLLAFASVATVLAGAWRLYQTRQLTPDWHCRTRQLLIAAAILSYLWFFFQMWLRLSSSFYFLLHAVLFAGICFYLPTQLSLVILTFVRATNDSHFHTQTILYGAASFLLLVLPYTLLANALIAALQTGSDPLLAVQSFLHELPLFILLALLLPASLILSLIWAAKDIALSKLTGDKP